MVLPLKRWKSRASPGIAAGAHDNKCWKNPFIIQKADRCRLFDGCPPFFVLNPLVHFGGAGWSSPVARQAHNLKVVGSNPTPATSKQGPLAGPFLLDVTRAGFDPRSAVATQSRRPLGKPVKSYSRKKIFNNQVMLQVAKRLVHL